ADQDLAEEDELAAPLDLAVGVDTSHRMIAVVGRLAQRTRIAPGRGPVERRRRLLAERLMRPLLVELAAGAGEAALLGGERRRRRRGRRCLERAVHAFVAPVLLRLARRDPLGRDAKLQPPDRQPRQAAGPDARKRRAVVAADRARQSELAEQ